MSMNQTPGYFLNEDPHTLGLSLMQTVALTYVKGILLADHEGRFNSIPIAVGGSTLMPRSDPGFSRPPCEPSSLHYTDHCPSKFHFDDKSRSVSVSRFAQQEGLLGTPGHERGSRADEAFPCASS